MNIESRLIEYGRSLLDAQRNDFVSMPSPWAQIAEMQYNAGARAMGFPYEMLDGVPCIPDGGLWEVVRLRRASEAADRSRRIREVGSALETIPARHRTILRATYCGPLAERIPHDAETAARLLQIKVEEFYDKLAPALEWMEYKLNYKVAA